jgi:hypothetical protein
VRTGAGSPLLRWCVEPRVSISATVMLTSDHCCIHTQMRVADVRAQDGTTVPDGFVALGVDALAKRLGVHRVTAWRHVQRAAARQSDPQMVRVVRLPVPIGSGARREALHVLWPVLSTTPSAATAA